MLSMQLCVWLAVTSTVAVAAPKAQSADVVFSEDFESGSLDQWDFQACPNGVTISPDQARTGNHSAKFVVSDDDTHSKCSDVPTDAPRAQLVSSNGLFHDGDEYYIGFSVFFPEGFPTPRNFFQVAEFYGPPFSGSPTMGVDVCNGNHICFQRDASHDYDNVWQSSPIKLGEWRDLVFHVGFSTDAAKGFVEIWDGGKQQTLANGQTKMTYKTLNPDVNWDGTPNTLNLNQYRSSDDKLGTVTLYIDAAKIGTTLEAVMPQ